MVVTPESAVMFYRTGECLLKRQSEYISSSRICLRTNIPVLTHGFDIWIMIAQMIRAGLVMFDSSLHPDPPFKGPQ